MIDFPRIKNQGATKILDEMTVLGWELLILGERPFSDWIVLLLIVVKSTDKGEV